MRQMWREIVNSYSVRKLTQIEDKLPALSGIATLLEERSGHLCLWVVGTVTAV
jgi:hypothetical protein